MVEERGKRPTRRRLKKRYLLYAFIGLGSLWYAWPFLTSWTHYKQDECSFGEISNAQYRTYLAEAKRLTRDEWPPLRYSIPPGLNNAVLRVPILERLQSFTANSKSIEETIARTHAVLRAAGGRYERTREVLNLVKHEEFSKEFGDVSFSYVFPPHAFGAYSPLLIRFHVFPGIYSKTNRIVHSGVRVHSGVKNVNVIDRWIPLRPDPTGVCPRLPSNGDLQ